jgi:hypothetical protein
LGGKGIYQRLNKQRERKKDREKIERTRKFQAGSEGRKRQELSKQYMNEKFF